MSAKTSECRFCLKKMEVDERMALIDSEIKDQFSSITQLKLHSGDEYSQIVCELCLRSLQLANAVKIQFIENQRKLSCLAEEEESENDSDSGEMPVIKPEPSLKRRRREKKHLNDDFVDPLQLVSIHELNDEFESDSVQKVGIKQENHDEYTPFKFEDKATRRSLKKPTIQNIPIQIKAVADPMRNFQCPHCDNIYKRRPHMIRHVETAHMKCKYICVVPNCDLSFVRKERLKKHLEMNHTDLLPFEMSTMVEKMRSLKPVYGNELPTIDDSMNDGMSQEAGGSSVDFHSAYFDSDQFMTYDNETTYKGIKIRSITDLRNTN